MATFYMEESTLVPMADYLAVERAGESVSKALHERLPLDIQKLLLATQKAVDEWMEEAGRLGIEGDES